MAHPIYSGLVFKKEQPSNTTALIRHRGEKSLTAIIWLFSFGLIFVTGQQMILELNAISSFKASISFYGQGLALISLVTIAWSFFRLFRYKQGSTRNRKKPDKKRPDEVSELVKFFKLTPEQIKEMRKLDSVHVNFPKTGITTKFPLSLLKELKDGQTITLCS